MDELDNYLGCRIDNTLLQSYSTRMESSQTSATHILIDQRLRDHWNRCPFCGASQGLYGANLEQHTPRCRYKGNANNLDVSVPNYFKMIDENDRTFLPMIKAAAELPGMKRKLQEVMLKKENSNGTDK